MNPPAAASPPAAGVLGARGLACRRGRRLLFEGLDIELAPGSVTWLRGANGSGKTSLMRILAGLSAPDAGEVTWNGLPVRQAGDEARQGIVYIGHANALKDDLSLQESLAFLGRLQGLAEPEARAQQAIERAGLAPQRHLTARRLSQGQRRRGALARLMMDELPRAWILDEPYDALDIDSVTRLSATLAAHRLRGGSVLLTSHQPVALPGLRTFDLLDRAAVRPG